MTARLSPDQLARADALVDPAIAFCETHDFPLGTRLIAHRWRDGSAQDVIDALAHYQNADGGFGRGLEVDIASPASNAFAARIAMHILLALDDLPDRVMLDRLQGWLIANQHADGDWHFAAEIHDAPLPPWFAHWEFPSLNPSCCVTGAMIQLGIATDDLRAKVRALFDAQADHAAIANADFYTLLPYVEYVPFVDLPDRDAWLDTIATRIATAPYDDASHFFEHALAGDEILARIPDEVIAREADRLLTEVADDGGWPSPYNDAWRVHATMNALVTLDRLRSVGE